ncbi:MAG: hypothetical protein HYT07_00785 [Candidatus Levybacteria bacterium]|nr:hypothetical protein [Candidatus Levybacteria bacterium]
MLGTKKGKRLLKAISEEGIGNISSILDKEEKFDDAYEDEKVEKVMPQRSAATEDVNTNEVKPRVRRFFRGITKRLN